MPRCCLPHWQLSALLPMAARSGLFGWPLVTFDILQYFQLIYLLSKTDKTFLLLRKKQGAVLRAYASSASGPLAQSQNLNRSSCIRLRMLTIQALQAHVAQ
jgi:hypothetical protein